MEEKKASLDDLPVEALFVLLKTLDYQDAKHLLSSTSYLKRLCKRHSLLELKAREFVDEHAPDTAPITSWEKYADLLRRGFSTTYHVKLGRYYEPSLRLDDDDELDIAYSTKAEFGYGGTTAAHFDVAGLPMDEEREAFLCIKHVYQGFYDFEEGQLEYCDFYWDYEDAYQRLQEELDSRGKRDATPYLIRVKF